MRRSTRQYKADLEELADGYQEARDYEFNQQFKDTFFKDDLTEEGVQGFLDSFDFPSESDWAVDEYESRRDSFYDAKYEEMRDERNGL